MAQDSAIELVGQSEDHMEVADREDLGFSLFKPSFSGHMLAFRAVAISAGVIGDAQGAAGIAALHPATQVRASAG